MTNYIRGVPIDCYVGLWVSGLNTPIPKFGRWDYDVKNTTTNPPASGYDMRFTVQNGMLTWGSTAVKGFFSNPSVKDSFFLLLDNNAVIFICTEASAYKYRTVSRVQNIFNVTKDRYTANNVNYNFTSTLSGFDFNPFIKPDDTNICFLAGALVTMQNGRKPIEDVVPGDIVAVHGPTGRVFEPVIWAGSKQCHVRPELPDDHSGYPVRIRANAFDTSVPDVDLLVTPEHCFLFDGHLTPIRMLVNGGSIDYDRTVHEYTYYHIATEDHSILIVNNTCAESHLDTGNRSLIDQSPRELPDAPNFQKNWADHAAAPLNTSREFVEPLFQKLATRSRDLGFDTKRAVLSSSFDADIHLRSEHGQRINPIRTQEGRYVFRLPPNSSAYWLCSAAARPCDLVGPFLDDRRKLGVLVGSMTLFEKNMMRPMQEYFENKYLPGWHHNHPSTIGWTNGEAFLPIALEASLEPAILSIDVISTIGDAL